MKIKKLTIHGFKSFVDKATLNFPTGTSGIIGPNGCGKSNIVDAIRWVLGEQNARHLRGKHMEDIIFNGSESRKPLGMAEVVLTFSNEEGLAPAQFANFTEIEISRRLYRSGESEYYINRVQSRLRDIVDLFTDTGIGSKAYSIIEQGQVGWLINAKPEERRAMFEEAAGINKFKHKKETALRRLESTRENLTRVNDIISEVKRQLNSLNRQAKKAERYKALKEELKSLDLTLSSIEFTKMKDALAGVEKRLEAVKDEEIASTTLIGAREELLDEIKVEYLGVENEYKAIRERIFELERLIQNEERSAALANARTEELQRAEERLEAEISDLKGAKEDSALETERLNSAIRELSESMEAESVRLSEDSARLESVSTELKAKEEAQRAAKAESFKISTRFSDIRHAIQTHMRDEDLLRAREAKAQSDIEEISRGLFQREAPLKALRERISEADSSRGSIESGLKSAKEDLEGLGASLASRGAEARAAKDEYAKASARLATLEEMERSFESLKGGAKAIMKRAEKTGVYGLMADVIETNLGFEKAVEAVLAEKLQYVLVESHREGVEAIEYLKANGAGRGSFIPVRESRPVPNPVPADAFTPGYPGVREILSEVKIKDGYQGIVGSLLGDVFIAENMDAALSAWRESGGYRTFVTPEGEIVDGAGVLTGGSVASDSGILQRRGEIKSVRALAAGLNAKVDGLEEELRGIEARIIEAKAISEDFRERLHRSDIEQVNLAGELKRHEDEAARLAQTRDALSSEIAEAGRRLSEISVKKAALSEEREGLEKALSEKEGLISTVSVEIASLSEQRERLTGVVTEARVSLASARERSESLKRELSGKAASIEEMARKIETRASEIKAGLVEASEKKREIEEIKGRLQGLLSRIEGIRGEEVSKAESLEALSTRTREVDTELKGLKSRYSELQDLKGELTIEARELELSINNLSEKILERYSARLSESRPVEGEPAPDAEALEAQRQDLREKIASLGEVSLSALEEYSDLERRHQFLIEQQEDLTKSVESLHTAITRINRTTREKFRHTFEEINSKFKETFPRFFSGGKAELRLTEDTDVLEAGVDIVAQPPGKRLQNITLLSGGEKALTATALIFAIFLIKPSPFCLLDEVDAPLDDANIDRFNVFVRDMSKISQFMLITHNKKTMEMADALYGITMQEPGVSKIISVRF